MFLDAAPVSRKEIVFIDTDRISLSVRIPCAPAAGDRDTGGSGSPAVRVEELLRTQRPLHDFPSPPEREFAEFLSRVEAALRGDRRTNRAEPLSCLLRFREILLKYAKERLLRDVLAGSLLEYHGINLPHRFLSDLLKAAEFGDFAGRICADAERFRRIFNGALDDYKAEFKFRYRQFPFPRLEEGELPFWIVEDGGRRRCFERDIQPSGNPLLFPRAVTLTMFLRLHHFDLFIHGVGGWNYEWVQDRVIEDFFGAAPPPYAAASGTFLIKGSADREIPCFFIDPQMVRERVSVFLSNT